MNLRKDHHRKRMPLTVARLREAGRAAVIGLQADVPRSKRGSTRAAPGAGVGRPTLQGEVVDRLAWRGPTVEGTVAPRFRREGVFPPAPSSFRCLPARTLVSRYIYISCPIAKSKYENNSRRWITRLVRR